MEDDVVLLTVYLVGWLVGFYELSTIVDYLMPNPFLYKNQFYFKQFSLAWVHSFNVKNISISNYSVQPNSSNSTNSISISIDFIYTQLNVKTVIYWIILV